MCRQHDQFLEDAITPIVGAACRHEDMRHETCDMNMCEEENMFSTLPPQGDGKIPCPWKLDLLTLRQRRETHDDTTCRS
jgi:hypothetical protein